MKDILKITAALCTSLLCMTLTLVQASSQEFLSLEQWMKRPFAEQEASYPFVRCAGLYEGTMNYIGTAAVGPEVSQQNTVAIIALSFAAMKIRSSKRGGEPEGYLDQVVSDRKRIAGVYEARMKQNYATTGQAFFDDPLIKSDLMLCKSLTESIMKR